MYSCFCIAQLEVQPVEYDVENSFWNHFLESHNYVDLHACLIVSVLMMQFLLNLI